MNSSDLLKIAKSYIDTPDKWCQRYSALDKNGNPVQYMSPDACKLCSVGATALAVRNSLGAFSTFRVNNYLYDAAKTFGSEFSPIMFNDNKTHSEVMEMFDKAINLAEKDEFKMEMNNADS